MQNASEFNPNLFAGEVKTELLSQAVRVFLSNQRQATAKTKTRSEINRTKKKWFKQKGTGNARHGARTPNIFVGGGVAHGPRGISNWTLKLSAKQKLLALKNALSLQKKNLFLSRDLASLKGKTKEAAALLAQATTETDKVLVVLAKNSDLTFRSLNNLANVLLVTADRLNVLQIATADKIIIDYAALKTLEDRLSVIKKSKVKK